MAAFWTRCYAFQRVRYSSPDPALIGIRVSPAPLRLSGLAMDSHVYETFELGHLRRLALCVAGSKSRRD